MPLQPNQQLDEFRIISLLGQGGFGAVYLAEDTLLDRKVAIKELLVDRRRDQMAFKRFLQEARTVGSLNHPNLVTVYALRVKDDRHYMIMEYVDGGSLRDLLRRRGKLDLEQVLQIALGVCKGLAAVHEKGIVHRDIKPENILLTQTGIAKVSDFGIAHVPRDSSGATITQYGFQPGTLLYMSPEQVLGKPVDTRSDIYQVGELLYEMLAGIHYIDVTAIEKQAASLVGNNVVLLQAKIFELLAEAICARPHAHFYTMKLYLPDDLQESVNTALAKSPVDRQTDIGKLCADLENLAETRAHGRPLTLSESARIVGRSHNKSTTSWETLGGTPGTVMIPSGYSIGLDCYAGIYQSTQIADQEFSKMFSEIHYNDLVEYVGFFDDIISDAIVEKLKLFPSLLILRLQYCWEITDASIALLENLPMLSELNLTGCRQITANGLMELHRCRRLAVLDLCDTQANDAVLDELQNLRELVSLDLRMSEITDHGLRYLQSLPNLKELYIGNTVDSDGYTDYALLYLMQMPSLEMLTIEQCAITDMGLEWLKSSKTLIKLELVGCDDVTEAGINYLRRSGVEVEIR